jgi:tRNA-2-methylthio-N6-dimethylallyladenosine synthase
MPGQIDRTTGEDRLHRLQALLQKQQGAFNASMEGRALPVLFDKPGRRVGQAVGRTPYLQAVHVDGAAHLNGQIAEVRIETAGKNSLQGVLSA